MGAVAFVFAVSRVDAGFDGDGKKHEMDCRRSSVHGVVPVYARTLQSAE